MTASTVMLTLLPDGADLRVEAYVSSRAAGFVKAGTSALLQFQAFPYQKFGSKAGVVQSISRVAIQPSELTLPAVHLGPELVYVATISIPEPFVMAYGRREPLKVGMSLDANLLLDKRSLLEWAFEPLYTVSGNWIN